MSKTRQVTSVSSFILSLCCCLSFMMMLDLHSNIQSEAEAKTPLDFEVMTEVLPNGLTLIMNPDHRVPTVAVEVRYMVGSGHERVGRSGFAHLFEHLMFQGSKNYDQEYFTPFTPIGGKVNGTTNTDRTNYFEQVPAEALELALWMESDRMEGLLEALTQEKLDNQRDVVKNERRQRYENTPYGMVWKLFANELFPVGHPYQHTTIGSHEDLTAASLEDVRNFFKQYYVPANAVITLVGDFEPKEARSLVNRYFGHLPSGERAKRPEIVPILKRDQRVITYYDRVKLPRVYLAWHTPALYQEGDAAMDLLASLLTSGKTSALYQPLVFEKQVAKDVFAFQVSHALSSYFVVASTAAPGQNIDELTQVLQAELEKTLNQLPSEASFTRALNEWRKSFYSRVESVMDRAQQLSTYYHFLGEANRFNFDLERYTQLTPQAVMKSADQWLKQAQPLIIRVLPETEQAQIDRSAPPKLAATKAWQPPQVQIDQLSNGLNIWLVEQSQSPLISLEMIINEGSSSDPAELSGLAWLTASLLDEGAGERDALQVSDALGLLATNYGANVSNDSISFSMDLLGENLSKSLDLFSDFILRPRFEQADFNRVKKQRIASALAGRADPRATRNRLMMKALFGKGASGLPSNGEPQTLEAITLADVKAAYQNLIKPQGATLIVAGNISMKALKAELERTLSTWQGSTKVLRRPVQEPLNLGAIHWIDFPGSSQSAVAMVRRAEGLVSPQKLLQDELFNLVFGGKFTSRLNLNLREDKGYTYGAYSGIYRYKSVGMHFIGGMIKGDQTAAAVKEMIAEIDGISSTKPIQADELDKMKTGELKGYPAQFEERSDITGLLAQVLRNGFDSSWLTLWMKELNAVTLEQTQASASTLAQSSEYSIVIAGDRSKHIESMKAFARPIYFYNAELEQITSKTDEKQSQNKESETSKSVDIETIEIKPLEKK